MMCFKKSKPSFFLVNFLLVVLLIATNSYQLPTTSTSTSTTANIPNETTTTTLEKFHRVPLIKSSNLNLLFDQQQQQQQQKNETNSNSLSTSSTAIAAIPIKTISSLNEQSDDDLPSRSQQKLPTTTTTTSSISISEDDDVDTKIKSLIVPFRKIWFNNNNGLQPQLQHQRKENEPFGGSLFDLDDHLRGGVREEENSLSNLMLSMVNSMAQRAREMMEFARQRQMMFSSSVIDNQNKNFDLFDDHHTLTKTATPNSDQKAKMQEGRFSFDPKTGESVSVQRSMSVMLTKDKDGHNRMVVLNQPPKITINHGWNPFGLDLNSLKNRLFFNNNNNGKNMDFFKKFEQNEQENEQDRTFGLTGGRRPFIIKNQINGGFGLDSDSDLDDLNDLNPIGPDDDDFGTVRLIHRFSSFGNNKQQENKNEADDDVITTTILANNNDGSSGWLSTTTTTSPLFCLLILILLFLMFLYIIIWLFYFIPKFIMNKAKQMQRRSSSSSPSPSSTTGPDNFLHKNLMSSVANVAKNKMSAFRIGGSSIMVGSGRKQSKESLLPLAQADNNEPQQPTNNNNTEMKKKHLALDLYEPIPSDIKQTKNVDQQQQQEEEPQEFSSPPPSYSSAIGGGSLNSLDTQHNNN